MNTRRLVIIGLDGVPYELLKDLVNKNVMPNVANLIKNGIFKEVNSTLPEISSVAWSSIITGKNPGEHGIFGFVDIKKDTYQLYFPNFNNLKVPTFWQKYNNLKYVIANVPSTYPASYLNGILISGFVAPILEKSVYPYSFIDVLKKINYRIDVDSEKAHKNMDDFIEDLFSNLYSQMELIDLLWEKEWDIFMYVFTGTDRLMHFLWDVYENKNHKYHGVFLEYFNKIDMEIGKIRNKLDNKDYLLIFSDHGFEQKRKDIFINHILKEKGFIEFDSNENIGKIFSRAKAFALDPSRIYLNLEKEYGAGKIKKEEKENKIKEITQIFLSLTIDGEKIIKNVYRKEDIYSGPFLNYAPDLYLLPHEGVNLKATLQIPTSNIFTGKHTFEGAFLLSNYNFLKNFEKDFSVIEIGELIEKIIMEEIIYN